MAAPRNYFLFWVSPGQPSGVGLEWDLPRMMKGEKPVIVDVGANVGQTVEMMSTLFPAAYIIAFEPSSTVCAELKRTHGHLCKQVHQIAVGHNDGAATFTNYKKSVFSSLLKLNPVEVHKMQLVEEAGTEQVRVARLDGLFDEWGVEKIDLLKIDTQGNDLNVLIGAQELLRKRCIRRVLVELNFFRMYEGEGDAHAILTFLKKHGLHLVELYEKNRHGSVITWCTALLELDDACEAPA